MPAKTPEQRSAYEAARRRSKRVKLRLTEDEAQRIRNAAAGAGMSLHTYMLAVADCRARRATCRRTSGYRAFCKK
jgi:uncharacterized protein (DUF1778 family)